MEKVIMSDWTQDEDLALAEIVLRHIREGKKMKDAWDEARESLNRTQNACQYRWSTLLSKRYEVSIEQAKSQRRNNKKRALARKKKEKEEMKKYQSNDIPVTKGVQQEINFDTYEMQDTKEDEKLESPFDQMESIMQKAKQEHHVIVEENKELKKDIQYLNKKIELLQNDLEDANNQLESYEDIKELIRQFNRLNN